jgi:hypothetical protein
MRSDSERSPTLKVLLALALVLATGAGAAAAGDLPDVAAQYRSEVAAPGQQPQRREWRLWRSETHVVREDLGTRHIEEWQRDGAAIFHRHLFPDERRGVELQSADLAMLGATPQWQETASVVPTAVLARLEPGRLKRRDGVDLQRYAGTVDGVRWKVTVRTDLMLPTSVERRTGRTRERLTLLEGHALEAAPWPVPDSADYDIVDFADLGDREGDPLVRRFEAALGLAHSHRAH